MLTLTQKNPEIQIEEVDILTSPATAWRDGIKMIPAIKIDEAVLSSLYLSPRKIEDFVSSCLTRKKL
ncbi:hypothetical protein [Desulforhopalus sp. 52FAK]